MTLYTLTPDMAELFGASNDQRLAEELTYDELDTLVRKAGDGDMLIGADEDDSLYIVSAKDGTRTLLAEGHEATLTYEYNIFDDPQGGDPWYPDGDVTVGAESEAEAIEEIEMRLARACRNLPVNAGYTVGQIITAHVWNRNGALIASPTYTLRKQDMIGRGQR